MRSFISDAGKLVDLGVGFGIIDSFDIPLKSESNFLSIKSQIFTKNYLFIGQNLINRAIYYSLLAIQVILAVKML